MSFFLRFLMRNEWLRAATLSVYFCWLLIACYQSMMQAEDVAFLFIVTFGFYILSMSVNCAYLFQKRQTKASIKRGLEQMRRGEYVDLGSFAEYLDEHERKNLFKNQ